MFVFFTGTDGEEVAVNASYVDSFRPKSWENQAGTEGGKGTALLMCDTEIHVREGMAEVASALQERLAKE